MGGIRRHRKKVITSGHPYDKDRLERELPLVGEYGLRNKKELQKARTFLSKSRQQARALLALPASIREAQEKDLIGSLRRYGILPESSDLDSILGLDVQAILERRLQTLVLRKGLAASIYQARQFVTHRHIAIDGQVVTSPSQMITINEENFISYAPRSPLVKETHPARPSAPPTVPQEEEEKSKGRSRGKNEKRSRGRGRPKSNK